MYHFQPSVEIGLVWFGQNFYPLLLAKQGQLTIYDIWRELRNRRDFSYVRYHIVNRRVRALEKQTFIERAEERRTKTGFVAAFYKLTASTRASH